MQGFLDRVSEAEGVLRSAKASLRVWEDNGGDSESAIKTRRFLGLLAQKLDDLENDLLGMELDNRLLTEKEAARHKAGFFFASL